MAQFKLVTRVKRGETVMICGEPHVVTARWPELGTGAMFLKARKVNKKRGRAIQYKFPAKARILFTNE